MRYEDGIRVIETVDEYLEIMGQMSDEEKAQDLKNASNYAAMKTLEKLDKLDKLEEDENAINENK